MKHSEDNDPVWDLIDNAQKAEPAGNFTQNVMREIRQLDSGQDQVSSGWFSTRWVGSLAAAAAVALGAFLLLQEPPAAPDEVDGAVAVTLESSDDEISIEEFAEELEELAYLGELMAVPDTSLLADEELAILLF